MHANVKKILDRFKGDDFNSTEILNDEELMKVSVRDIETAYEYILQNTPGLTLKKPDPFLSHPHFRSVPLNATKKYKEKLMLERRRVKGIKEIGNVFDKQEVDEPLPRSMRDPRKINMSDPEVIKFLESSKTKEYLEKMGPPKYKTMEEIEAAQDKVDKLEKQLKQDMMDSLVNEYKMRHEPKRIFRILQGRRPPYVFRNFSYTGKKVRWSVR